MQGGNTMAKAKRTRTTAPRKDFASKITMNPPAGGDGKQDVPGTGIQDQDPKRRIGQYGGTGEPPLMKR
jgi:hypothetical protein